VSINQPTTISETGKAQRPWNRPNRGRVRVKVSAKGGRKRQTVGDCPTKSREEVVKVDALGREPPNYGLTCTNLFPSSEVQRPEAVQL